MFLKSSRVEGLLVFLKSKKEIARTVACIPLLVLMQAMSLTIYIHPMVFMYTTVHRYEQNQAQKIFHRLPSDLQGLVGRFLHEMCLVDVLHELHQNVLLEPPCVPSDNLYVPISDYFSNSFDPAFPGAVALPKQYISTFF